MSDPDSPATKVLVLHGCVAYLVIVSMIQLALTFFSPGMVKVPTSSANA
jgi:hypothetical protein